MENSLASGLDFSKLNDTQIHEKYLTFFIDNQLFGVSIAEVVQIVSMQHITQIPSYPPYAKGIISMRSIVIPVIDVRLLIGKNERPYDDQTCIIITSINEDEIGFIVDKVNAVTDILPQNISPPPKLSNDSTNTYITGVAKHENATILLLDAPKLLIVCQK